MQVDDGRLAEEVGSRLQREELEAVALDLEVEVADGVVEAHVAANATATSPASPALATASLRFTSRVRPLERSWSVASTNGVTAWPEIPRRAASVTASSIRSPTSMLSGGGFV